MSRHCFRHCFSMRGRRVGCSELLFCGKGKGEIKKVFVDAKVYIVGWFGLRFPANLRAKRSADEPGGASARDPEAHVSGVTEDLANQNQSKFGQREQRRAEAWERKTRKSSKQKVPNSPSVPLLPNPRSSPIAPVNFTRALVIKIQKKMRSQKVCLLASPVTRRRWALRLYNAYTSQAKSASNSFPILCSALPTSMWKISPAFC